MNDWYPTDLTPPATADNAAVYAKFENIYNRYFNNKTSKTEDP